MEFSAGVPAGRFQGIAPVKQWVNDYCIKKQLFYGFATVFPVPLRSTPMSSPRLAEALSSPASLPSSALAHVWQGDEVGRESACLASGHAALDLHLPGGGWPEGGLVEVLQARPEAHAWRLVLPALAQAVKAHDGPVVLVAPPREPFGPSLAAQGLPQQRLLWVRAGQPAARLWAVEQALRCVDVAATLAWLPQARQAELRRLHLLSQQQGRLFFAFRALRAQQESSPARLRLLLESDGESDVLRVHLLKRRGPPLVSPVLLAAQEGRLAELLRARRGRAAQVLSAPPPAPAAMTPPQESPHALAGLAVSV